VGGGRGRCNGVVPPKGAGSYVLTEQRQGAIRKPFKG
jgi:hypothetical protein